MAEEKEIAVGDMVVVRGRVVEVIDMSGGAHTGEKILRIEWESSAPLLAYVKPEQVEIQNADS